MAALVEAGVADDEAGLGWRTGSRTDKGVSALGNVVAFDSSIPAERVGDALGGRVEGLWPRGAVAVPDGFEPRWAESRTYLYFLSWPAGVDQDAWGAALEDALALFVGRHDLGAFAKREEGRDPVRTVSATSVGSGPAGPVVSVRGRSFLWQQVRRMVGAAVDVAGGVRGFDELAGRLVPGAPPWGGTTMPAEGLVLWDVRYRDVTFPAGGLPGRAPETWARARQAVAARAALLDALAP